MSKVANAALILVAVAITLVAVWLFAPSVANAVKWYPFGATLALFLVSQTAREVFEAVDGEDASVFFRMVHLLTEGVFSAFLLTMLFAVIWPYHISTNDFRVIVAFVWSVRNFLAYVSELYGPRR